MKQEVLSQFNLTWVPVTGLLIFVVCFAIYIYWTFKKTNKNFYEEASLIPLKDDLKGEGK